MIRPARPSLAEVPLADLSFDDKTLGWQINLVGPILIERFAENIGTIIDPIWQYRITKSGHSHTAILP